MSATGTPPMTLLRQLVEQLDTSQWASAQTLMASQRWLLRRLAEHHGRHTPSFAERLGRAGLTAADLATEEGLLALPVLTRRDLQALEHTLDATAVPDGHGGIVVTRTSGSSGEPVVVHRTFVNALFWHAMTMRELWWHQRATSGRLCVVRANVSAPALFDDWGPPASLFGPTGPRLVLPIASDARELLERIRAFAPTLLVIYPGPGRALAEAAVADRIALPSLQQVLTIGELLSPTVRELVASTFGVTVADCYSSEEVGHIALECPDGGGYHAMSESLLVEVLADDGRRCSAGEVGRVAVTDLHNYATPLIRYEIGDRVEVGASCDCGRGLPTWRRIVGRERHLILMPDGTRHWPVTGFPRCRDVAPVQQYQLVQLDRETIEARLVVERPLSDAEEEALRACFHRAIGHQFAVRFAYRDERIPTGPGGKYEEFICNVPTDCSTLRSSSAR